jgi:hypothetical protein
VSNIGRKGPVASIGIWASTATLTVWIFTEHHRRKQLGHGPARPIEQYRLKPNNLELNRLFDSRNLHTQLEPTRRTIITVHLPLLPRKSNVKAGIKALLQACPTSILAFNELPQRTQVDLKPEFLAPQAVRLWGTSTLRSFIPMDM